MKSMKRLKLNTWLGNSFDVTAKKAKDISIEKDTLVEFEFNGIICVVDKDTNLDLLWKDYRNAHLMDWKEVDGRMVYTKEVEDEMKRKQKVIDDKQNAYRIESDKKEKTERDLYYKKVEGINIELKDSKGWEDCKEVNDDPYGKCAVDYAESWAKLMQVEMAKGERLVAIAEQTSHELGGFYGITGYMYGAAVSMLSKYWIHGEELRKWHNKEYNHEGEGVVNPAILSIS